MASMNGGAYHLDAPAVDDTALCNMCGADVSCQVVVAHDAVQLRKHCAVHGPHDVLLSTDPNYWKWCCDVRRRSNDAGVHLGQRTPHMTIVEVIDECDLACPTCIAASTAGSGNARPRAEIVERVRRRVAKTGQLELVMVSGGEPALHPEIVGILGDLRSYASQVMLITNGVRIATDPAFAKSLSALGPQVHVYLQFDSMNPRVLTALRGMDYSSIRKAALEILQSNDVSTTLVCVVKRGLNDEEVADTVRLACQHRNVKGVTFQPIRSSGRHADFDHLQHSITLSEVRARLMRDLGCTNDDIAPHPRHPEKIAIGYFLPGEPPMRALTQDVLERDGVSHPLYLDSTEEARAFGDLRVIRVAIISFLDRYDFTHRASEQGGIVFLMDDESIVPLDRRFLQFQENQGKLTALGKRRSVQ